MLNNNYNSLLLTVYKHDIHHIWMQEPKDQCGLLNTRRKMEKPDYKYVFSTDITPVEALDTISRVTEWWASDFEGSSQKLHDVFTVHFGEVLVTFRIVEVGTGKKISWLVTDCNLTWLKDIKEWKGTRIEWEVSSVNNSTQISMTHIGLVPGIECYNDCEKGWNFHIGTSLFKLITEGVGMPDISTRK